MAASIKDFYPKLADVPEIVELVEHYFGEKAHHVLECMKTGEGLEQAEADDLEELLQDFVTDHALEVTSFQGLGQSGENSSRDAMDYLEKHHPEAHHTMLVQAEQLQKLLGKDAAARALGQTRQPFTIRVLHYEFLYVVTAEEFEEQGPGCRVRTVELQAVGSILQPRGLGKSAMSYRRYVTCVERRRAVLREQLEKANSLFAPHSVRLTRSSERDAVRLPNCLCPPHP